MKWLRGKRTILGSIAAGVVVIISSLNLVDEQVAGTLLGVIVTFTGVSLRLAVGKGQP